MPSEQTLGARRWVVIDSFPESAVRYRGRYAIVCVDVFNAATTLVSSLARGRATFAAKSRSEAASLAAGLDRPLLAGEIDGQKLDGYDLPDSPAEIEAIGDVSRPLVLYSSPASELLAAAADPTLEPYIMGLRNLGATAGALARSRGVAIVGAGHHSEFSCEDQFACAQLAYRLVEMGFELADLRSMEIVRRWRDAEPSLLGWGNSAATLRRQRRGRDIDFVLGHYDDLPWACRVRRSGELERVSVTAAPETQPRDPAAPSESPAGAIRTVHGPTL